MYIIIAGGGLVGKGLATKLVQTKHDVVVIDIDPEVCEDIYASTGALTINGNATDLSVLENARIDKCDNAIALMKGDSDNLSFALLAKHFQVPQIMVRMSDTRYEEVYKSAGVTNIARTTQLIIDQLNLSIESPELRKVIGFGDLDICIIEVPEGCPIAGKTILEMAQTKGFPTNTIITAIYYNDVFTVPKSNTIIKTNDKLFVCGTLERIKQLSKLIHSN